MTATDSKLSLVTSAVAGRGFIYSARDSRGWLMFSGDLQCSDERYHVILSVDPQGLKLPEVRLTNVPAKLRPVAPHIADSGFLCYAAAGSIVLDVFDPAGQVLACIDRAESVLNQILRGEMVNDLEDEFFAYWGNQICLLDISSRLSKRIEGIVIESKGDADGLIAITNNPDATKLKLKAMGFQLSEKFTIAVRRVKSTAVPRPLQNNWPPRTVQELLHWQSVLDSRSRKKLEEHISEVFKSGVNGIFCLIESPRFPYGFTVIFNRSGVQERKKGAKHLLSSREIVYRSKIASYSCLLIDDSYIAQRNIPGGITLAGRKIALVGCGTIGGYLADLLVKSGAGAEGGQLTLIDHDCLMPQNVGRHRLGFNSILRYKARAVADEIQRGSPTANIRALPVDVMHANLEGSNLIIDATGEEGLGNLLVEKFKGSNFVPYLKVWIEGPGTAIRCLLRDSREAACPRCLSDHLRSPMYPVVNEFLPIVLAGHGCESLYVPFPATVSVQAACLGVELTLAWAGGLPSPRLRSRVLDSNYTKGSIDLDPQRLNDCPACST